MDTAKMVRHFSVTATTRAVIVMIVCLTFAMMVACGKKKPEALPPPVVEVVEVLQKDMPIYAEYVGTADGFVNATIRAQVQGYLIRQNYKEGDFVKKGQILFIRPEPRWPSLHGAMDEALQPYTSNYWHTGLLFRKQSASNYWTTLTDSSRRRPDSGSTSCGEPGRASGQL